jgi:hypothetical protein
VPAAWPLARTTSGAQGPPGPEEPAGPPLALQGGAQILGEITFQALQAWGDHAPHAPQGIHRAAAGRIRRHTPRHPGRLLGEFEDALLFYRTLCLVQGAINT